MDMDVWIFLIVRRRRFFPTAPKNQYPVNTTLIRMGKKLKIGKQRKDKYYYLSKEAGYRSRAAFKLIQLNKRFEFLQNSRVLIDLCAAPGGWLQVAAQNMPMSSVRIGVDLVPIRPIKDCVTLQGDITEEKTRHAVKRELNNWEADCVLHDGAPNVGTNWNHDAFSQNLLTLSALRLATQVLRKGGSFITKIFRSADYLRLTAVFEQLFKRVHIWKPAASRLESAEIFVVCERYEKPDKIDAGLLNSKEVFALAPENSDQSNIANPQRLLLIPKKREKRAKALGYADGDITQWHELQASQFVSSPNPLILLGDASRLIFDTTDLDDNIHTTMEVRECAKDVKVCGPGEIRALLNWRKKVIADIAAVKRAEVRESKRKAQEVEINEADAELIELEEIDDLIRNAQANEKSALKRKKAQLQKQLAKQRERQKFEMNAAEAEPLVAEDLEVFSLKRTKKLANRLATLARPLCRANAKNDDACGFESLNSSNFVEKYEIPLPGDKNNDLADSSDDELSDIEICNKVKENEPENKKLRRLTPEQLALGELMIYSSRSQRDLEDWAWNKYTCNDDGLPSWFIEDEQKHWRKDLPVDLDRVEFYKQREKALNVHSIKKVVEAKMRKKKRQIRAVERVRKRAEGIVESEQLEEGEKLRELRKIYKKAKLPRKRTQLQVVTKGKRGSLPRPKGPYKLVDKRMKKDLRSQRSKMSSTKGRRNRASA